MFPFHCNQCYRRRKYDTELELFVSRCGHIFCKDCIQENCCVCKRPFKAVAINKDMPSSMAEYFSSPLKQYQHYKKVMQFHHEQERRLVEHMCQSIEEDKKKVLAEIQGYAKLDAKLMSEIEKERERIRKLREYIAYYDRRFEQTCYMSPPISSQPRPRHPLRNPSVENVLVKRANANKMNRFSQPIRPIVMYPNSPTLSTNNSSITAEKINAPKSDVVKKQRTPPPLLPFSQHKLLNLQFSSNSSE